MQPTRTPAHRRVDEGDHIHQFVQGSDGAARVPPTAPVGTLWSLQHADVAELTELKTIPDALAEKVVAAIR